MTLAEYIASKGKKEETSLREVKNEFEGKAAADKREEEDFMKMGEGKKKKEKKQKETKQTIAVGFRVAKPSSGDREERRDSRGGRGDRRDGRGRGRGGGRGGRGAGRGPKGGNKKPQGLNALDASAFPSL